MSVMIEVDPELFITCRLCLQDMGQYQIVPKVGDQIKYCFDIEVEPFDGLPQLICKKCEEILSRFYETKSVYLKKQEILKGQLNLKKKIPVLQQETIQSLQQNGSDTKSEVFGKSKKRKRISRISSTTSESSTENNNNNKNDDIKLWTHSYIKQFACRFCQYINSNQNDVLTHVSTCHKQLKGKYHNIFKKHCLVQLPKLGTEPNITGSSSTVVLGNEKIIEQVNIDYFIIYSKKGDVHESSDSDDDMIIKNKQKRCRLISKSSSNETVVVHPDEDENEALSVYQSGNKEQERKPDREVGNILLDCIKIDDSSDSDCGKVSVKKKIHKKLLQKQQGIMQNIISVCKNNLRKNIDDSSGKMKHKKGNQSTNVESQLKHKLLSIGRKIVNKQGFNCTGLLRYMERKNLEITWMPKSTVNSTINTDYIRIMTKLKDNIEEDDSSWKSLPASEVVHSNKYFCIPTSASAVITKLVTADINNESTLNGNTSYIDAGFFSNQCKNKLLNKNPVANPKQLPKKGNVIETKSNNHYEMSTITQNQSHDELRVNVEPTENSTTENTLMPIITGTTSLASLHEQNNANNNETADTNVTKDTGFGRIKVKPVSELMPEGVLNNVNDKPLASNSQNPKADVLLNNMNEKTLATNSQTPKADMFLNNINENILGSNSQNPNADIFKYKISMAPNSHLPLHLVQVSNETNINVVTSNKQTKNADYIILDTVELPNTKTDSPFKYLQKLLQIHSLVLLDTKETLGTNFICLIKFKVKYKESFNDPVILCLSLFCYKNIFCIKVNDRNQENINMKKISANWQWEIIKIFTGETVNKLLQNAEKISREVYENTKNFCCLLKSINVKSE